MFYFLIGDEIFPLITWLMRPFPGKNATEKEKYLQLQTFYRAQLKMHLALLAARWGILLSPIHSAVESVEKYVCACLAQHNYLRQTSNAFYTPQGFVD